jgi:hypothetical protein
MQLFARAACDCDGPVVVGGVGGGGDLQHPKLFGAGVLLNPVLHIGGNYLSSDM